MQLPSMAELQALESIGEVQPAPAKTNPVALPAPTSKRPRRQPRNKADALTISLPVFASMRQCNAVAGIPIKLQQEAKDGGSTAIDQSGRVDLQKLLRWIFGQDERAVDWGTELKRYQALREKIKWDADQKRVIDRTAVGMVLAKGMALMFQKIDNEFGLMLPPTLKGMSEVEIQKRLLEAAETFKSTLRDELQALSAVDINQPKTSIQNENSPVPAQ